MTGKKEGFLTRKEGRLIKGYKKSPSLTYFLKGILNDGKITILPAQSSAMLSSFIEANCLVQLVEGMEQYEIDEKAEVILIA
jgi:molybdopterin molybdotransferase